MDNHYTTSVTHVIEFGSKVVMRGTNGITSHILKLHQNVFE
jgi:hypothetical protein